MQIARFEVAVIMRAVSGIRGQDEGRSRGRGERRGRRGGRAGDGGEGEESDAAGWG